MSTITIGGNGGFIAGRPGETAITIQHLTVQATGTVSGFWTRRRLRRFRPTVAKVYDCKRYWDWLSEAAAPEGGVR